MERFLEDVAVKSFPPWLTSHSKGLQNKYKLVSHCVVGIQTVSLEKVEFFPLRAWESFSFEDEYSPLLYKYERKKKKKPISPQ